MTQHSTGQLSPAVKAHPASPPAPGNELPGYPKKVPSALKTRESAFGTEDKSFVIGLESRRDFVLLSSPALQCRAQEAMPGQGNMDNNANPWRVYKAWFWAATAYNVVWGTVVGLKPSLMLDWMGMTAAQQAAAGPLPLILAACIGMFVGVYALGYACVALDPPRFWPFALLGLCGKILGLAGWALHHFLGHLPWSSLWVNVFNDLIWWPAFFGLLWTVRREFLARRISL